MSDVARGSAEVVMQDTPEEVQSQGIFASEEIKNEFTAYIQKEVQSVVDGEDTAQFLEDVKKWKRQRIARPAQKTKDYPFPNSANVSPPITAQKVNTIYAKALANFSTKRPFWAGDAADVRYRDHVNALTRKMNDMSQSPFELHLDKFNRQFLYDTISLGTNFYEVSWDYEQVTYLKDAGPGQPGTPSFRVLHNGPRIHIVPIEDFITRPYWTDLQKAPWLARRFRLTHAELMERKASGRYENVDAVDGSAIEEFTDHEQADNDLLGLTGQPKSDYKETNLYDLYAFHAFWDVNGDGVLEDIKGVLHLESGTILRIEMNNLGWRLVGRVPYQEIPGWLYGLGVCHACEYLQDEGETLHNLRLDNLKWSMMNMFVGRKGSGLKADERAYPGKLWLVDQDGDLKVLPVPDLSSSSYQAEMLVRDYADRITGANDPMSGFADQTLKSGGGAQAQMVMMQQASSILNSQLDTMEEYYAEMGRMIAILMAANIDLINFDNTDPKDAELIRELLSQPTEMLPQLIKFRIETTDAARSEAAKRDNYAAFTGLYDQYTQQVLQLTQIGMSPQVPPQLQPIFLKLLVGRTRIMEKMVEFLKLGQPKEFLPYLGDLEAQIDAVEEQKEAQSNGATGAGAGPVEGQLGAMGPQSGMGGAPMGNMGGQPGIPGGIPPGVGF